MSWRKRNFFLVLSGSWPEPALWATVLYRSHAISPRVEALVSADLARVCELGDLGSWILGSFFGAGSSIAI